MNEIIGEGEYLIKLLGSAINNTHIDYPREDFSWSSLFTLAAFHSVANTAFYGLQKLPDTSIIPENIYEQFSTTAQKYSSMEALQQFETRQIFQRFEQNQIFCIPLDGHIIKSYYPRTDMRYISTLSGLINSKDKNKIHVVLNSLGYTLVNTTHNRINYLKDGNINLSLRTSLLPEKPEFSEYFKNIEEKVKLENSPHFVSSLTPEDFYVYNMAQLAHLYASGGAGIRSVLDIWVLLKRLSPTFDREYINYQLNELNLNLFAYYMEEFSKMWFDIRYKGISDNEIYEHMSTHLFENYKIKNYDNYSEKKMQTDKKSDNSSAANKPNSDNNAEREKPEENIDKKVVFPPLEQMKEQYPILNQMPFLLPIYWLVRIFSIWGKI